MVPRDAVPLRCRGHGSQQVGWGCVKCRLFLGYKNVLLLRFSFYIGSLHFTIPGSTARCPAQMPWPWFSTGGRGGDALKCRLFLGYKNVLLLRWVLSLVPRDAVPLRCRGHGSQQVGGRGLVKMSSFLRLYKCAFTEMGFIPGSTARCPAQMPRPWFSTGGWGCVKILSFLRL